MNDSLQKVSSLAKPDRVDNPVGVEVSMTRECKQETDARFLSVGSQRLSAYYPLSSLCAHSNVVALMYFAST